MNYTEFVHAVETMINQRKEGGLKATVYTAVKNNDTRRTGVILETPGINLSPTIYLEEFYESYLGGKTINEIVVQNLVLSSTSDLYEILAICSLTCSNIC